jgi:hypothetical protein
LHVEWTWKKNDVVYMYFIYQQMKYSTKSINIK